MMNDLKSQIVQAIQAVRQEIRWKPGSAERHLQKRKQRGQLPDTATFADYENQIRQVISAKLSA